MTSLSRSSGVAIRLLAVALVLATAGTVRAAVSAERWLPVDSHGWTTLTTAPDSLLIHVSSSVGDDANDGFTPERPKRTIEAAAALLRLGHPDHLLLRRGDVFEGGPGRDPIIAVPLGGRSPGEPMVIAAYGAGPRPRVVARQFLRALGRDTRHLAVVGLDLHNAYADPESPQFDGGEHEHVFLLRVVGTGSHLLVEDCRLRFAQTSIQGHPGDGGHRFERVVFRRNIIHGAWINGSSTRGAAARISNVFVSHVDGLLIEENVVDHGGWNPRISGAGSNMFNHDLYLQGTNRDVVLVGNILARAASQGAKFPSGGIMRDNLLVLNSIGTAFGSQVPEAGPRAVEYNVVLAGTRKTADPSHRGFDPEVWGIYWESAGGILAHNLVAHRRDSGRNLGIAIPNPELRPEIEIGNIDHRWTHDDDSPDLAWPDPGRDLARFNAEVRRGPVSAEAFLEDALAREGGTWPTDLTASVANRWIREGFGMPHPPASSPLGPEGTRATHASDDPLAWAFRPARDAFSSEAAFDLRALNEAYAGEHGFVRASPEGAFLRGDGAPLRFWAVNLSGGRGTDEATLRHAARFLAKRGVNLWRWHGFLHPKEGSTSLNALDEAERDACWRTVAAMRREGIYACLSPYWARAFSSIGEHAGFDRGDNRGAQALLFFEPRLQEAYRAWLRDWLVPPNPYTGIPLKDDPAVAVIQLQNEDSLLFPTLDRIAPLHRRELGRQFGAWLLARHGDLDAVFARWGDDSLLPRDSREPFVPDLLPLESYRDGEPLAGSLATRHADQIEFLAETMLAFNESVVRYLREELGVRALINTGNWKTASMEHLNDAERWTQLPGDVAAVNRYFSARHLGERRGFAVAAGDTFANVSLLRSPRDLPLLYRQPAGMPFIVSESTWTPPNRYRAEAPLLVAALGAHVGIDAYFWFNFRAEDWTQPQPRQQGWLGSDFKWGGDSPDLLGQFPGLALAYRRGDFTTAAPALVDRRPLRDVLRGVPPLLNEDTGFDPNQDSGDAAAAAEGGAVDPETFLDGPVLVAFDQSHEQPDSSPDANPATVGPWCGASPFRLDADTGTFVVDVPTAQGATGFLGASSPIETRHLRIAVETPYAAVTVVSLDGLPLDRSERLLVQLATPARPTGWTVAPTEDPGDLRITAVGGIPWSIERLEGTLVLENPSITRAAACDPNGIPWRDLMLGRDPSGFPTLHLPGDTLYVLLTGESAGTKAEADP